MRKTRFMSLLFLVWSIAFFMVPDFRQAIQSSFLGLSLTGSYDWLVREGTISPTTLDEAVKVAEAHHDAQTLAFAAMHPPHGAQEGIRLAAEAVATDPHFTWIYPKALSNLDSSDRKDPKIRALANQLETWDADNAVPYLLEGEQIKAGIGDKFPSVQELDGLAKETEWRGAMQKAFAAPHYDSYALREFDLERQWLGEHYLAKPSTMLLMVASYPIPNLVSIRAYSNLLVKKLGKEAEAAGHLPEATNYYWTAAHMGERMQLYGPTLIERLIGISLEKDAYERLIPVLRMNGQADEAATLQYSLQQMTQNLEELKGNDPLSQSANYIWAALIIALLAGLVGLFGLLTFISVCYVNAKQWIRPDKKGRIYELFTVAENYLTILLFLSCLGLYITYFPYAQNFHHYMTTSGDIHNLEPFIYNVLPSPGLTLGTPAPIHNPFTPYAWYALIGLLFAVLIRIPSYRRSRM